MNKEFQGLQFMGTVTIIITIAGLALLIVALQMAGRLSVGEVGGLDQAQPQDQSADVFALAEPFSGQNTYSLNRGWKSEEIGAEFMIPAEANAKAATGEKAVNLGYFLRAEAVEPASGPAVRGWKVDEIGGEAIGDRANEVLETDEIEDALNLGSYFETNPSAVEFHSAQTMHNKLERLLAEEAAQPGQAGQAESCQPEPGFSPNPC